MKKLVVFGDSFVQGAIRLPVQNSLSIQRKINFVTQISKLYAVEAENLGKTGNSNINIAQDVFKYVRTNDVKDVAILVVWSNYLRPYRPFLEDGQLKTENYMFLTEQAYLAVENILTQLEIPFLFTNSFFNHRETDKKWLLDKVSFKNWIEGDKQCNTLYDILIDSWDKGFGYKKKESLARKLNVENQFLSPCKHPSEKGHIKIAQTIFPYLKEVIK